LTAYVSDVNYELRDEHYELRERSRRWTGVGGARRRCSVWTQEQYPGLVDGSSHRQIQVGLGSGSQEGAG